MPLWYDAAMNKKTSIEFDPVTRVDLDPVMMQTRRSNQSARRTLAVAALLALIFVILHADNLVAQSSIRYELGSRLRRFEARFENHLDDGGRKLVLESMSGAVSSFFGMQMQDAAQGLDQAWIKLWPAEQRATAEWVASRQVRAANHLLDESGTVTLQISEYYPGEFAMPANGKFVCDLESLTLADVDSGVKRVGEFQLSQTELKLPGLAAEPGDYAIRVSVQSGDNLFPVGRVVCSRLLRFEQRMEALEAKRKSLRQQADAGTDFDASAIATLKDRIYLLRRWAKSSDLETDFLACLELRRLEALSDNMEQPNWLYETSLATRSGQKILPGQAVTIAGEKRKKAVVRLFVPDAVFEEPEQAAARTCFSTATVMERSSNSVNNEVGSWCRRESGWAEWDSVCPRSLSSCPNNFRSTKMPCLWLGIRWVLPTPTRWPLSLRLRILCRVLVSRPWEVDDA